MAETAKRQPYGRRREYSMAAVMAQLLVENSNANRNTQEQKSVSRKVLGRKNISKRWV
jgi:hypothetical protein